MTAKAIFGWILSHLLAVAVAGAVVYLAIERAHEKSLREQLTKQQEQVLADKAKELGATQAEIVSERQIIANLQKSNQTLAKMVADLKKTNKGATVSETSTGTGSLKDTSAGKLTPETATTPPFCEDAFNRWKVNTKDCTFERNQSFRVSAVTVRGVDGKSRFTKQILEELDPVTGVPIAGGSADLKVQFAITEDKPEEPPPFHLRAIAGVNEKGSFGAGIKFWSWKSLDASLLGFYDRADKSIRGAFQPGYRLVLPAFNSTISVGPNVFISSKGQTGIGAGLTVEVTR